MLRTIAILVLWAACQQASTRTEQPPCSGQGLGSRGVGVERWTYEEGEGLLELVDLLLGEGISLRGGVSERRGRWCAVVCGAGAGWWWCRVLAGGVSREAANEGLAGRRRTMVAGCVWVAAGWGWMGGCALGGAAAARRSSVVRRWWEWGGRREVGRGWRSWRNDCGLRLQVRHACAHYLVSG